MNANDMNIVPDTILEDLIPPGLRPVKVVFSEYFDYDKQGHWVHRIDSSGNEEWRSYNEEGNIVKKFFIERGRVRRTIGYLYNKDHTLKSEVDSKRGLFNYAYETDNDLTKVTVKSTKANSEYIREYIVDGNDRTISETIKALTLFDGSEIHRTDTSFVYNDAGLIIRKNTISTVSVPSEIETLYEYDSRGNCIRISDSTGDNKVTEYDDKNRPVKVITPIRVENIKYFDEINAYYKAVTAEVPEENWYICGDDNSMIWHMRTCKAKL